MKAKIYVGAKKYALYIGRKIVEKTLEFLTLPARFVSKKVQELKNLTMWGQSKQDLLPDGYTQLEYIEGTGTQFIDTNFMFTGNKGRVDIEYMQTKTESSSRLFGYWISTTSNSLALRLDSRFYRLWAGTKELYIDNSITSDINVKHSVSNIFDNGNCTIIFDGVTYNNTYTASISQVNRKCYLFSMHYNASPYGTISAKIYSCKIYDGDTLAKNLIPAKRNSDGVLGMYDTVSNTFLTNAGTGTFIAGGSLPSPTNPVEVESVGDKSKNLLNPQRELTVFGTAAQYFTIDVPNGTYTLSTTIPFLLESNSDNIWFDNQNERFSTNFNNPNQYTRTRTVTTNNGKLYVAVRNNVVQRVKDGVFTIQVEQGTQATPYEPYGYKVPVVVGDTITTNIYLSEPLRRIGEYTDTMSIDGTNVTVTRNVAMYNAEKIKDILMYYGVYVGHNTWYFDIGSEVYSTVFNSSKPISNVFYGMSLVDLNGDGTKLPAFGLRYQFRGYSETNIYRIYFYYDGITDKTVMLNKLREIDCEIYTLITTPRTETYTIGNPIQLEQGTLTLDTDTKIKPSKINITGDIDNE